MKTHDMTVAGLFRSLRAVVVDRGEPEVCRTVAAELVASVGRGTEALRPVISSSRPRGVPSARVLRISAGRAAGRAWVALRADGRREARLEASDPRHIYVFFRYIWEVLGSRPLDEVTGRRSLAFRTQRPVWDLYFSQAARAVGSREREAMVRRMARFGFTHVEVNGLASHETPEPGVPGEVYPCFYTYLPALDQFTDSFLNRGVYPRATLRANLERLRDNSRLACRYGLVPAMTCFEPRSVPERLLERYPELRGARVDHPFRSFKPRYNLAVSHPVVRAHYREMIQNLLRAVPELEILSIWTNDSGAGFEFTRSLYVGPNGSAYLVREWSEQDAFARAAADNAVNFLRLLQQAGAEINPRFRVATRLEPFTAERERFVAGLGKGFDLEVASLFDRGWKSPYGHSEYRDCSIGPFTFYNDRLDDRERRPMRRLARRGLRVHFFHAHGPAGNFEPLLGIPAPWLTHEKLQAMERVGVRDLAHMGGLAPPSAVPFNVNEEIHRRFIHDPRRPASELIEEVACGWAGPRHARTLLRAWQLAERGIRGFMPNPLYFSWGVWYRILVRPLVPDIERIPERERAYYERHLLSTHHNPARFDLSRDVLFRLMTRELAEKAVRRDDRHALPWIGKAIALLRDALEGRGLSRSARRVFRDQLDRLVALRCLMTTLRDVSSWIACVHGWLASRERRRRTLLERRLQETIDREIAASRDLFELWRRSRTTFMACSPERETTFVYDRNFGRHLRRKITLMERHRHAAPRIDPNVMWRVGRLPERVWKDALRDSPGPGC